MLNGLWLLLLTKKPQTMHLFTYPKSENYFQKIVVVVLMFPKCVEKTPLVCWHNKRVLYYDASTSQVYGTHLPKCHCISN